MGTKPKESKYIWLRTNEYVNEMSVVAKFLYYIGVIKQKRYTERKGKPSQIYTGGLYRSQFGFRWWHPISVLIAVIFFILVLCSLVVECIIKSLKNGVGDLHKFEIVVDKHLIKNNNYRKTEEL